MLQGAGDRNELIVPGPLTSHHAQVLARNPQRCDACHTNAKDGFGLMVTRVLLERSSEGRPTQSSLCLDCHQDLATEGAKPLSAHGLPGGALGHPSGSDGIACATCHQEHHGALADLSVISDARCQACHEQRYDSFASDHPEFALWPAGRRTRIAFNHATHQSTHHPKANQTFDCRSCHLEDATGDLTERVDYQGACASCHEAELRKGSDQGIALLALPLSETSTSPEQATRSPLVRLLAASAGADGDATAESSIASLMDELQEEGHEALSYRLGALLGSPMTDTLRDDLLRGLPVELIDHAQSAWLEGVDPDEPFDAVTDRRTAGGWFAEDETRTIRYRPSGHDDPFLRAWIDLAVALPPEHRALRDKCLEEFSSPDSPGQCLTCHTIDRLRDGSLSVNWSGRDRLNEPRGFTHFSHRPHVLQPELSDCTSCHTIDPAAAQGAVSTVIGDPREFRSDFVALRKSACVDCHQPHAAGDHCSQCHNYHVSPMAVERIDQDPGVEYGLRAKRSSATHATR